VKPSRNLEIGLTLKQNWNVALSVAVLSTTNGLAIAPEKHCMLATC
jgi:hypothetical protein